MKFHILVLAFVLSIPAQAAQIDPMLAGFARGRSLAPTRVLALLESKAEGIQVPNRYDRAAVVAYLQTLAARSASELQSRIGESPQIRIRELYWVNNSAVLEVTPTGLRQLAQTPGVRKIYANGFVRLIEPARRGGRARPEALPYPYKETGLDRLIQSARWIDGSGVLMGHIDTGVDASHPALRGKIAKYWDNESRRYTTGRDSDSHGTHTAGTIVGGDRNQIAIGVAPAAKLISSGPLGGYDDMLASMQLMLEAQPRAVSNSWHAPGAPDIELFYNAVAAWEAAGILPIFAAGNSGPSPRTIGHPQVHPVALVAGATGEDGRITDFSSRGPGDFHGTQTQKPDLTAPGDNVNSSVPGGGYEEMSGTSMACPHVAGAAALLYEVDARLTPDQMRRVLMRSTNPVDQNGNPLTRRGTWNAIYGLGKMNIPAAVQLAQAVKRARDAIPSFFFTTLEDQEVADILRDRPVPVSELFRFPEGAGEWMTPDQVWN